MDTIRRSAANSPGFAARDMERVRPIPHSAKDRLERYDGQHPQRSAANGSDASAQEQDAAQEDAKTDPSSAQDSALSPPPPIRPPPSPGTTLDSLEDGVEAIRRLMAHSAPKIDLQR